MLRAYRFAFFLALISLLLLSLPVLKAFGATPSETRNASAITTGSATTIAAAANVGKGCHIMTPTEADAQHAAGNDSAKAGEETCGGDQSIFTKDAGEAKNYLRSIFNNSNDRCSRLTGDEDKIGQLNPTFAICAAKFLKAVRIQDPSIRISSAYRTADQQACLCGGGSSGCAAANKSNHQ